MSKTPQPARKDSAIYLPPDGYSRFFVIIKILRQIYGTSQKTINILDVGGCSPFLKELLEESGLKYKLTILDILPKPPEMTTDYIQADATKSDLPAKSYDVVISTDTLEHIPGDTKDAFVLGCVRLCRDICILAAPFDTPGVDNSEHLVNDFNKQLFRVGQDWLEEHFKFGKPSFEQTRKVLDKAGVEYEHFGTNNLYSWIFSTHMNLIEAKIGTGGNTVSKINLDYNQQLGQSIEFTRPTYRQFFVIYKDKKPASKNLAEHIAQSQANPDTFTSYLHSMFSAIAERMSDLKQDAEDANRKTAQLEQKLHNEFMHSQKLNNELIKARSEIQTLSTLSKPSRLRHPRSTARAIKKRLAGKS